MKPLCIYHGNCADGFGAAWAVRQGLGKENVEFFPGVYQERPPDVWGRHVIMVDFSYKRPVLEAMAEMATSILILDHHKTAVDDLAGYPEPPADLVDGTGNELKGWLPDSGVYAKFDMNRSGAAMAWDHFCGGERPALINHIEDRDLWRFNLEGTREIQASVFSYPYNFDVWDGLMRSPVDELRSDGEAIERKHFKDIREFIDAAAYRMEIAGYDVPVLNAPYFWSSDAGHIMAHGEPFAACYWDTEEGRIFSLRSAEDGIDVSEIAKMLGGGGHKHASGYRIDKP